MTPPRSAASVGQFAQAMAAHGATPEQVQLAAIDMSPAYQKGVSEHLPQAQIVFDRFHLMQLAGGAVDEVRKQLRGEGADMKGALWALRGNESALSQQNLLLLQDLGARHKRLGRAMALRESLQQMWEWPGKLSASLHLEDWCSWAVRSRLPAFTEAGANYQGSLGWHPGLLPAPDHLCGHLLLDGWRPQPQNPFSFYPPHLAKNH